MKVAAKVLIGACWALALSPAWPNAPAGESLTISIAAPGYWCPYACNSTQPLSGFAVDIARAALESEGHKVVYRNLPYDRALLEVRAGRVDAILPSFKGEAPDFVFPSYAVSQTEYCFYVSGDEPRRYDGLNSLKDIRFVATSGYTYGEEMDAYISDHQGERAILIGGEDVSNRLRELVRRGRVDALLDDRLLFESGQNRVGLVNAGCLDERHRGYLALSPEDRERSNAIAEAFDRGFKKIRKDGQLCGILENYGLGIDFVPDLNGEYC
ncbi:ABC transporter substrate-binding protein [Marinobacter sp. BW6]|uniref:substrate-binding periplasmic protein n=1 Tax=Marinobacter sp. BW6 TaxID=2592624 RepID=UPI0011DE631F|nr:ABC transporter substrate-binding protein [Marinobacter sp. BW6]TYC57657.1 ABC transporter substrate-binding protein [Marinobacter sp. BW6]